MNYALILSGGIGSRMRDDGFPKQYLEIQGKPILLYTLENTQACPDIDRIVVVAHAQWEDKIWQWAKDAGITKLTAIAQPGETRQHSILSGLLTCEAMGITEQDIVLIHDGVRPLISPKLLSDCVKALPGYDAVLPVLPMKDTIYYSETGTSISALADRSKLFCGQSPDTFWLKQYLELNRNATDEQLVQTRGGSEIAHAAGWNVRMIPGEETNFKVTTPEDLRRLAFYVANQK